MEAIARNVRVIPANPMLTPTGRPRSQKERVAAYCRVSTDMEQQASSLDTQTAVFHRMIAAHAGWEAAGIYADADARYGQNTNRP